MARRPSKTLTEGELRIMNVLWKRGASTALEIVDAIKRPKVSRSSIMTVLAVLERKGFVTHAEQERSYVFSAIVDVRAARRTALDHVLASFFGGSVDSLMASLISERNLSNDELRTARRIIDDAGKRTKP